jgi:predicted glutamine amidotransferase
MCRLLGVVSAEAIAHGVPLLTAPRSLAELSPDHPDGWGIAAHDDRSGWEIDRGTLCARNDPRYRAAAGRAHGSLLVAHVRLGTVGAETLENTHPFRQGRWLFAHNGTILSTDVFARGTSARRQREIQGQTDSERLFALLLTAIDAAGGAEGVARAPAGAVDRALAIAASALAARPGDDAATFVCSDGEVLYAFRHGRTMHLLERDAATSGTAAALVASEHLTDEPWRELTEGVLMRADRGARPRWRAVDPDAGHGRPRALTAGR